MTVNELYLNLDSRIPRELSCDWDNDGLMCCPDGQREVKRALVALDVTFDVIDEAISGGYDLIVSHHPFIFSGLKSVNDGDFISKKVIKLIRNGISVMSFHTRLDSVSGGVNDTLAELLELQDITPFGELGMGRIGNLAQSMELSEFAEKVKLALGSRFVLFSDGGKKASRIAVLGGGGDDFVGDAMKARADTYLSGRIGYHHMTDAPDTQINLIEAGHFFTENPVCDVICRMLSEYSVEAVPYFSNRIKAL